MKYNIFTIGCQMNKADSERISFYLEGLGFIKEDDLFKADLVIFVTCSVKQSAEDRAYGLVNTLIKNNKKAIIALTGCLSDRPDVKERLKSNVDIFFNISDLPTLNNYLKKYFKNINNKKLKLKNYLDIPSNRTSFFSAFVPIGNGCNNFCSYCVVPYARGRELYRPAEEIIKEVKSLIKNGYKEITLIAQNVNSYKTSLDFPDLLREIDNIEGDFWIRFYSSHPKDVSSKLIKVLKDSKHICEHFHLALQSGDDQILSAMNRKYKYSDYKKTINKIRSALDYKNGLAASITTDIIVGFPGETKKNFLNSKKALQELSFDLIYIAKYSPRYGTASAKMKDSVSLVEKKRRELELNDLLKKIALKNNKEYLSKELDILVEGFDRKNNLFGKTRTSKIVRIKVSEKDIKNNCNIKSLVGQFIRVKINKVSEFELSGELLNNKKEKLIVILGPTASGKTSMAVKLAYELGAEIISADSRQVYRGMDIGSGKDLAEYFYKGVNIPYHLIDVCNPKSIFSLAKYQKMAQKAISEINKKSKVAILVGGSGLYLEALVDNYDLSFVSPSFKNRDEFEELDLMELQKRVKKIRPKFFKELNNSEKNNKRRLARYLEIFLSDKNFSPKKKESLYDSIIFGIETERSALKDRIYKRLISRIEDEGMISEIENLKKSGLSYKRLESFGLEYRFVARYLQKKISYQQLIDNLFIAICQFSKKQSSWFKRWEKNGAKINWIKNFDELKDVLNKNNF